MNVEDKKPPTPHADVADEITRHRDILSSAGDNAFDVRCTCGWEGGVIPLSAAGARHSPWRLHRAQAVAEVVLNGKRADTELRGPLTYTG